MSLGFARDQGVRAPKGMSVRKAAAQPAGPTTTTGKASAIRYCKHQPTETPTDRIRRRLTVSSLTASLNEFACRPFENRLKVFAHPHKSPMRSLTVDSFPKSHSHHHPNHSLNCYRSAIPSSWSLQQPKRRRFPNPRSLWVIRIQQ